MTTLMAEAEARPGEEAREALLHALAVRFGDRFSRSEALREQHANTLTWLKVQAPDAVLFAESTEEVSEVVKACAAAWRVCR
jgi:D-lactate dehydrogenase (cytochrome)